VQEGHLIVHGTALIVSQQGVLHLNLHWHWFISLQIWQIFIHALHLQEATHVLLRLEELQLEQTSEGIEIEE
jgi:hypothetical protein